MRTGTKTALIQRKMTVRSAAPNPGAGSRPTPNSGWKCTEAAHINGYVGGYGTLADLQKELDSLGLSPAGNEKLVKMVSARQPEQDSEACAIDEAALKD